MHAVDDAFAALEAAFDGAAADDATALRVVVARLSDLQRALAESVLPAEAHAFYRARLDAARARLMGLLAEVAAAKETLGQRLAELPRRRDPVQRPSGGLVDLSA